MKGESVHLSGYLRACGLAALNHSRQQHSKRRISIRANRCATFICMVTVQEAFTRAKAYAREVLGDMDYTLEEIEQDSYKGRPVWRVTLGFPKRRPTAPDLMRSLGAGLPLEYKVFLVDADTGDPIAMKLAS